MDGEKQIVLITGPVCSEKTLEFIRKLRRHQYTGKKVEVFRPSLETRTESVYSRFCGGITWENPITIQFPREIIPLAQDVQVYGIEEAQFFEDKYVHELIEVILALYQQQKTGYIAALDTDFQGKPFKIVELLMPIPEVKIIKLTAVCVDCGKDATRSFKTIPGNERIVVGFPYVALCFDCWTKRMSERIS